MRIFVIHGPNLNLLGERSGDEKGKTLPMLDAQIRQRAATLGLEVKLLQSNHEGAIVDALHAERRWFDGVVINPGALTHSSYVLREAIAAVGKPAIEVHLTDIRRRESWRRKSVIKDACSAQVIGKGFDSYLIALDRFATGDLTGRKRSTKAAGSTANSAAATKQVEAKSIGRKQVSVPANSPPPPKAAEKTLGRVSISKRPLDTSRLSRALVRQRIADRLSGKLSPAGLATWARTQWLEVQRGAPAESGQRELLEDSLQSLVLSAIPSTRLTDNQLVELMAQLDG